MKTGFELGFPSAQNAIDLIPDWISLFPAETGVKAGAMDLFHDPRIAWAMDMYGDVNGKKVLELGPLEGAHTLMLTQRGALVDAVEANRTAYLKCLIAKEILQIQNARFHLGDCIHWAEQISTRYDLIVACGVLYHMVDPLRLLRGLARLTDNLYIWTVCIDNEENLKPSDVQKFDDLSVRVAGVAYGKKDLNFTGGTMPTAFWMHKNDLLAVVRRLGYDFIETAHDRPKTDQWSPATVSIYARRTTPLAASV
jgi:hypothetical protein